MTSNTALATGLWAKEKRPLNKEILQSEQIKDCLIAARVPSNILVHVDKKTGGFSIATTNGIFDTKELPFKIYTSQGELTVKPDGCNFQSKNPKTKSSIDFAMNQISANLFFNLEVSRETRNEISKACGNVENAQFKKAYLKLFQPRQSTEEGGNQSPPSKSNGKTKEDPSAKSAESLEYVD